MLHFVTAVTLALQTSVADSSPFRALPLPAANRVRSASGAPGPDYWQQRADYVIRATLDTAGSVIRGTQRIHYANHSPDTLAFVWVQIEQNRKSTRLNSSHGYISYAVFCLKKKKKRKRASC